MPARAIIDLPKMPESCSKCDEAAKSIWIEGALIESNYPYCRLIEDNLYENFFDNRHFDCPFREVPEWTEEDSKFINLWLNNVKCLQEKLGNEEIMALRTLKKLCKLARVEVAE